MLNIDKEVDSNERDKAIEYLRKNLPEDVGNIHFDYDSLTMAGAESMVYIIGEII